MEPLLLVSGDGHLGAQPQTYKPYLEAKYHEYLPQLEKENQQFVDFSTMLKRQRTPEAMAAVDTQGALATEGDKGCWDIKRRMQELDREGVAAEIVFPGHQHAVPPFFSVVNNPYPAEVRAAGRRAHHRWFADCHIESGGRMFGIGDPGPCVDMKEAVEELQWIAAHGFVSVQPPGNAADAGLPPLTDKYFDPFWATCAELGLVVNAHAGYGQQQGRFWEFAENFRKNTVGADMSRTAEIKEKPKDMMAAFEGADDSPLKLDMGPRRFLWQLMLSGAFDRHPKLKACLTEVRADWLPPTLDRLDALAAQSKTPLKLKPSEYWTRNCFITPSSIHICEMQDRYRIGIDNLIFGTDYPHPEGTWPNTKEWIRLTFKGVPEAEARKILGETAIRCFGLDKAKLLPIVKRIGLDLKDLLVDQAGVHPLCVDDMNARGGILQPAEKVRAADIDPLFNEDLNRVMAA